MLDDNSLNLKGLSIDDLYLGMKKSVTKTISENDVYTFAGIIGDFNPVHVNEEYAKSTRFGSRIVHGMLTASFVSTVFGMLLPGADAIYLGQTLKFLKPVRFGDTITATAEVTKIVAEKKLFYAKTTITNQKGELVVEGEGTLMATKAIKND
jgi:3-hydroxybutyryl-CoA dehydratase